MRVDRLRRQSQPDGTRGSDATCRKGLQMIGDHEFEAAIGRCANEAVLVDCGPSEIDVSYITIYCDADDELQFLSNCHNGAADAKLVALRSVLNTDPTLWDVVRKLRPGNRAFRTDRTQPWFIEEWDFE